MNTRKVIAIFLRNKGLVFSGLCVSLFLFWIIYEYAGLYYVYLDKKKIDTKNVNAIIDDYSVECVSYFLAAFNDKNDLGLMRFGDEIVYISAVGNFEEEDVAYLKIASNMLNSALDEKKFEVIDYSIVRTDISVVYLPFKKINMNLMGNVPEYIMVLQTR